jgi:hypothetical protein
MRAQLALLAAAGALWLRGPLPRGLVGGRAFLPVVATQSLVVLGATLSRARGRRRAARGRPGAVRTRGGSVCRSS